MDILLADDHAILRSGLRHALETREGWHVCAEVADGREAVDRAVELRPDVAVLDMTMPGLNGIEATRRIRDAIPATRVVLFTMHAEEEIAREALRAGVTGFVLKSDPSAVLFAAIEAAAAHRRFVTPMLAGAWRSVSRPENSEARRLTSRQREVVQLIAEGATNARISELLGISLDTVEAHRFSALRKMRAGSIVDLVRYALRNRLVSPCEASFVPAPPMRCREGG
jgi:DNA-binding NarL/FixJ family response regulator